MASNKKLANAVGGRTARACDNCIRKRARWYCPADDAFLCQTCDASVHSANPLAHRHERVRLKTSSWKKTSEGFVPSWHRGFTRKARTPRHGRQSIPLKLKSEEPTRNSHPLVPEMGSGETSNEENDEQILYRVPEFDPFVGQPSTSGDSNEAATPAAIKDAETTDAIGANSFHGFLHSEMELAEFAADVESLLGKGLDEESFDMEALGLLDCKEKDSVLEESLGKGRVKVEDDDEDAKDTAMANHVDTDQIDVGREPFELNFDYDSLATYEEEEEDNKVEARATIREDETEDVKKKKLLRLDYDAVITAWANYQRSPWTTGDKPALDHSDSCWPYCMGNCRIFQQQHGDVIGGGGVIGGDNCNIVRVQDRGREARVSRYREKRRTRLFSKKIRYEVRKLNAEKRPRMKGRFVKRGTTFAGPAAFAFAS